MWQDFVLLSGNIIFAVLLIPMLIDARNGKEVNLYTSGLTCLVLVIFNATYLSLGLWFAALPFTALMWSLIFYYSLRGKKENGSGS